MASDFPGIDRFAVLKADETRRAVATVRRLVLDPQACVEILAALGLDDTPRPPTDHTTRKEDQ